MYRLLFQGSRAKEAPVIVREPLVVIGRDSACQLRLLEKGVSDRHAAIERREDGYYLCDLNSATGVRVNDQPAALQRLTSGDLIELGSVRLQFEILHDIESPRRAPDWLQLVAGIAVALLLVGQVLLLVSIFREPRPAVITRSVAGNPAPPDATVPPGSTLPAPAAVEPTPAPATEPARPAVPPTPVLNRMIRLRRVSESTDRDRVRLAIEIRAQVGERELDTGATAVAIQFFIQDPSGKTLPMRTPLWLNMGGLKNFSTKLLVAYFPGQTAQYGGYVIRSYYRGQLQDQVAAPAGLAELAPDPLATRP